MRIPLDYYRILGLPIQATAEQLKQSHRDRALQVPRREYSELAIEMRRQLIDTAYAVLGDSVRRTEYDQEFLAKSKRADDLEDPDTNIPTIEIEDQQLVGALLILLELGEYELVLRLGRPYLKRDAHTSEGQLIKEQPALPDIILTLAVACLELGREEWQQNHYEHAAESLETGRELLLREDLFPVLRAEIQADLYKLRPYRCLELIARPLKQKRSRQEGIALLRGMLQDRGGIDGADDDLSGLGVDDFLRFVQQLRSYLTAAEQQEVFEAEAQRPSAVGTYLAVYALLARGFAQHQPALIRRAKQMLLRLSGRQDVHLEQAVCAVLLGQTEEASRALELSQEYEPLAFIREHSHGAPDLLPGLCLYAENWLQQEVFPFFRDLDQELATLKDYFADSAVQSYLENLPLENERDHQAAWAGQTAGTQGFRHQRTRSGGTVSTAAMPVDPTGFGQSAAAGGYSQSGWAQSDLSDRPSPAGTTSVAAISKMSPLGQLNSSPPDETAPPEATDSDSPPLRVRSRRRSATVSSPKWGRVALVVLAALLCLGLALGVARAVIGLVSGGGGDPAIEGEPLDIEVNQAPIETEVVETAPTVAPGDAAGIAKATIEQWLAAKAAAFSQAYEASEIDSVLTGTALRDVEGKLQGAQRDSWYANYTHGPIEIVSVEPEDATDAERLSVQAEVKEAAAFYENGQPTEQYDYDQVITADYEMVRQDGQWLIESIQDR
ncbi:MAG: IMS domain-containing protein [Phormidesmis sp.]